MTVFGLTGGIACGKSTVAKILQTAGATIVDADVIARSIVNPGSPVLIEIFNHFGAVVINKTGYLNRRKLGELVFNNPDERRILENIMQRPIQEAVDLEIKKAKKISKLIGYDCALIIELNQQSKYRPLVVVASSLEIQIQRLMNRNKFTKNQAQKRINTQMPTVNKIQFADYVIWNNLGMSDLRVEVMKVYNSLVNI